MGEKSSGKSSWGWIVYNLLAAVLVVLVVVAVSSILLDVGTKHNKEIVLPDFKGMTLEEANSVAASVGVRLDVRDSIYASDVGRGCVFSQNPPPGNAVKEGRRVVLTLNAHSLRKVRMPDIVDLTLYEAEAKLVAAGLELGTIEYVPSTHDRVVSQMVGGSEVRPGRILDAGTMISVTVGQISGELLFEDNESSLEDSAVPEAVAGGSESDDDVEIDF